MTLFILQTVDRSVLIEKKKKKGPQRVHGMTDVANDDNEDGGRAELQRDEAPQRPCKSVLEAPDLSQLPVTDALRGVVGEDFLSLLLKVTTIAGICICKL